MKRTIPLLFSRDAAVAIRAAKSGRSASSRLQKFARDEDGAVVAYSFFILLLMLVAGGIAIDVSRQEMQRARLQNTLDTAVLAAAGATYTPGGDAKEKAKTIVEDYFAKADLTKYLHTIDKEKDIVVTVNSSKVTASASMELDTYLMHLSGVKTLSSRGASTAERRVPKLEVAMVLDVSGSMNSNRKLTNLQAAAKKFVTTVLGSSEVGDTVVSVVPFSWTVAPGEGIYQALKKNETQNYSTCLRFSGSSTDNDYEEAFIDPDVTYDQQIFTSVYGGFDSLDSGWRSCFTEDYATILPYSISESELHTKIDALHADGNTSGHLGMKWGAAMLDPKFQKVKLSLDGITEEGATSAIPAKYNEAETLKVIIMMGDGMNTTSYYFNDNSSYRGPNSALYKVTWQEMKFKHAYHIYKHKIRYDESKCSNKKWECVYEATGDVQSAEYIRDFNDDRYYDIKQREWMDGDDFEDLPEDLPGFISAERMSWEMAWGRMSPRYYSELTGDWGAWNDYVGSGYENGSTKNALMSDICTATKNKGVIVYTIGFEISKGGTAELKLKDCASSAAHYYRAEGVNINDAFNSIASNVVNLRLTQ